MRELHLHFLLHISITEWKHKQDFVSLLFDWRLEMFQEVFMTWKEKMISWAYWMGASWELQLDVKPTGLVHPDGVCGDAGEDGGLLVRIAPHARHKASYAMDIVIVVDVAAERASKVTLEGNDNRRWQKHQHLNVTGFHHVVCKIKNLSGVFFFFF